ncbi:MAG: thioredoxin family protein [Ignavibacteriaceae bacterium]|nr:thioredoxin family protein [Ignavibacteriaceae bacterium]
MKKYFVFLFVIILSVNISAQNKDAKPKVTFVELGSVNCIPCKMMQPVMESIEKKYGDQVKVIFYDVWTQEQKKYAQQYKIKLIPTQVFLDASGKEFHRHEGFYPEEEIDKILQGKGLTKKSKK